MPTYSQSDLELPTLDLLSQHIGGLSTTELIGLLTDLLKPTGDDSSVSKSRPGEPNFHQRVRNLTAPSRNALLGRGWVTYSDPGGPIRITQAGRDHLAASRASGAWQGFEQEPRLRAGQRASPGFGSRYRPPDENAPASPAAPFVVDPNVVDRGTRAHKRTQNALADFLSARGVEPESPRSNDPDFDVGWTVADVWYVAEVKSLTDDNESRQMRLGLGQVLDYRFELSGRHPSVIAVLMVEHIPRGGRWVDLCKQLGVVLAWPENLESALPGLQRPAPAAEVSAHTP